MLYFSWEKHRVSVGPAGNQNSPSGVGRRCRGARLGREVSAPPRALGYVSGASPGPRTATPRLGAESGAAAGITWGRMRGCGAEGAAWHGPGPARPLRRTARGPLAAGLPPHAGRERPAQTAVQIHRRHRRGPALRPAHLLQVLFKAVRREWLGRKGLRPRVGVSGCTCPHDILRVCVGTGRARL